MKKLAIGVLLLSATVAKGEFVQTKEYLDTCAAKDEGHHIACVGYVAGVVDSYIHSGQFCVDPRTDTKEISTFVIDYILRTKQIQNYPPVGMIILALKARWPCINSGPGFKFNFQGPQFQLNGRQLNFNFGRF
jgi:hypothetical protein